jgi:diguanylate cyclase (GGDEF)-like protein
MLICQVEDVSERQRLHDQLEYLTDHDLLTGLFNRRRFEQELERETARSSRDPQGGAVLMIDLDGFKAINDEFGHAAGDRLLRGIAASLAERVRASDLLARLSGDEFAVLLPGASRAGAELVARELLGVVARHVVVLGAERAHVTASIGMTLLEGVGEVELLALADAAMYAAKAAGRNQLVVYDPHGEQHDLTGRFREAAQLRRALREERFVLYCQPICALPDQAVAQYELLIRMRGSAPGELIAPNAFLYAAERFGLIADIDAWVVTRAAELIATQAREGRRIVLSVNLSGRSIGNSALAAHIDQVLADTQIDPGCLVFEITETAAIANIETARAFTEHLRRRGCRFALDDFGAGFASFYYLKALPFDFIKIDGNFVQGLTTSATDQLVIVAIVSVARGMDKTTIAEHVADQATSELLAANGVDLVQGFHVGAPRPVEEVLIELSPG